MPAWGTGEEGMMKLEKKRRIGRGRREVLYEVAPVHSETLLPNWKPSNNERRQSIRAATINQASVARQTSPGFTSVVSFTPLTITGFGNRRADYFVPGE